MFNLNRSALDFLLQQINIGIDYSQLTNALDPSGLREVAGTNNNLVGSSAGQPGPFQEGVYFDYGATDTPFVRMSQLSYTSQPVMDAGYGNVGGNVTDANPRTVSLLVSDSNVNTNPAVQTAVDASESGAFVDADGLAHIPNAGVLGGGKFNDFFVGFGQFFDHGLDFIQKTDSGTIAIPLSPNDPVYIPPELSPGVPNPDYIPGVSNIMYVSRASVANLEEVMDTGAAPIYINNTAMDIDQSQTYGSTASLNALLREYTDTGVVSGRVVAGDTELGPQENAADTEYSKGLATWADVKANALRIGVELTDQDIAGVPMLRVDATGNFLDGFTPDPAAHYRTDQTPTDMGASYDPATDPFVRNPDGTVMTTRQPFLIDINPAADPFFLGMAHTADADSEINDPAVPDLDPSDGLTYDNELLDAHFIAGDGRINENYQVTAVHNVFHEEHNYQVDNVQQTALKEALLENNIDVLNNWLADGSGIADFSGMPTAISDLAGQDSTTIGNFFADPNNAGVILDAVNTVEWNGNSLFHGARIIVESEYNHIAIDQFFGALYGALPEFVSYSADIDLGVTLEFAQSVYRLGHSMLTENITEVDLSAYDPNAVIHPNSTGEPASGPGIDVSGSIIDDGALNPVGFAENPAGITLGQILQVGEEIDEFIAPAIQNTLNGQLLDLGAIDIARGRDVGLPTLNELRDQVYKGLIQNTPNTNGSALAPYKNWADLGDHLKNPGGPVDDPGNPGTLIWEDSTLLNLIAGYARDDDGGYGTAIADARADYESGAGTLDEIRDAAHAVLDDYANGDAAAVEFMRGTPTFNPATGSFDFVGANQGFWDVDLWIGGLAERPLFDGPLGTTFSYIMLDFAQKMQDGDRFYYLYRTPMGTELGNEIIANQFGDLVARANGLEHLNGDVFIAADKYWFLDGSTWLEGQDPQLTDVDNDADYNDYFNVSDHFLDDGSPARDGHNVVVGGLGIDWIIGGLGDDTLWGDDGNDILEGSQGNDHIYGGAGDDFITDDENDDFIRGGPGNDIIFAGPGVIDTVFGDEGDDEIHGGDGVDELLGGDGDDRIYGDGDTDAMFGGFGNDYMDGGDSVDEMQGQEGNDWMRGGVGDDHLLGGEGNDLLEGGLGPTANDGDRLIGAGAAAFEVPLAGEPDDTGFDIASYEDVDIAITANLDTSNQNGTGPLIDTYVGIDGLVGSRFDDDLTGGDPNSATVNGTDNYLIGGAGDDRLTGLGGNDFIFGDGAIVDNSLYWVGDERHTSGDQTGEILNWYGTGEDRPVFADGSIGHYLGDNADDLNPDGTADVAVFSGNIAGYTLNPVTLAGYDAIRVVDINPDDGDDGTDILVDVEIARFADGDVSLTNSPPTDIQWIGIPPANNALPANNSAIANLAVTDADSTSWTFTENFANLSVSPTGEVTRSGPLQNNQTYTGTITADDGSIAPYTETFNIRTGNNGANNLVGDGNSDIIYARRGADTISGGGGDDTIYGQGGNDTITGGEGNDAVYGGAGNDTVIWNVGDGRDTVDGGANGGPGDTFEIFGDASVETFDIHASDDYPAGYTGSAEIVVTRTVGGVTEIIGELTDIEELAIHTGAGTDSINIHGTFTGILNPDTITINVQDGNVTVDVTEMTSDEHIVVNVGEGTYNIVGDTNGNVEVNGTGGTTDTGATDTGTTDTGTTDTGTTDTGTTDTSAVGDADVVFNGGRGADTFASGDGDDDLDGGRGDDTLNGGAGDDDLNGGRGDDTLDGGDGDDDLNGGRGNDRLIGGEGDDDLTGGDGDDMFVFEPGFGYDVITDFHMGGHDTLEFHGFEELMSFSDLLAHTSVENGTSTIIVGNDVLILEGTDLEHLGCGNHDSDFEFIS